MEDLILHPDIAEPVMTLSDRDMGTLFKALMIYRWRGEEPKDLSAAADMAAIDLRYTRVLAPISGRIGRSLASEGALVAVGQPGRGIHGCHRRLLKGDGFG